MAAVTLAAGVAAKVVGAVTSSGAGALVRSNLSKHGVRLMSLLAKGSIKEIVKPKGAKRYAPYRSRMSRF